MDMTGWLTGQVFLQTVDDKEVQQATALLTARGIPFQVLTQSERMQLDAAHPEASVSSDRFSVAVHIAGFPQVVSPVLDELIRRAHGAGWQADPPSESAAGS